MPCDYYEITELSIVYKDETIDSIEIGRTPYYYTDISGDGKYSNTLEQPLVLYDNGDWIETDVEFEYTLKYNHFLIMFNKNIPNIQKITKKQFNVDRLIIQVEPTTGGGLV